MNKFWNIATNFTDDSVLNMYVYGDIVTDSHWLWGSPDDVVTREFIKDLNNHPKAKRINVYINSGGGEVFAAVSIAQQLKKHSAEVHTYVEGIAASAATIIAMAGDVRHMTVSGLYMIHLPSSCVSGNKHSFAKGIEILEKVEDIIRLTYKDKTNLSDEELTAMIDHETWLTAEEAYKYGFVNKIEEDPDRIDNLIKEVQDDLIAMNGVNINIAAYAEPDKLRAKLTEIQNKKDEGGSVMDFQAFLNSLPADKRPIVENALKEQIDHKTEELTNQVTNLTEQVTNLTNQLTSAQGDLTATQEKLTSAENKIQELENSAPAEDADTKFLNSLPAEARQAVLDARKAAADAQAALAKANEDKAFAEFQDKVKAYDNLPLQDAHVKALYNMSKSCPEDFASVEALFDSANNAMGGQFKPVGQDGDGNAPENAYDEIEQKIKAKREEDPTMDYNTAFVNVISENPELYNRYRNGQ
jgi:ATP-dependent Clp protease protease subunit